METCLPNSPESSAGPAAVVVAAARCLRCGADLSRLPEEGRYCPRCGLDTHASPPGVLLFGATAEQQRLSDMLGGWQHLTQFRNAGDIAAPPVPPPQAPTAASSEILEGYANALYSLGRRYERGEGTSSNPREAMRCYCKSARLGNLWAMARLAAHWMAHRDPFGREQRQPSSDG